MKLSEVMMITPAEHDRLRLPSSIQRMLPIAQAIKVDEAPVEPRKRGWSKNENPRRLERTFLFTETRRMLAFLNEIFEYEKDIQHHARITIEQMNVNIKVWTRNIEDVTQVDINYSRDIDDIYKDVKSYNLDDNDTFSK